MACAVLLIFFNKLALSSYAFNHANLITLLQLCCSTTLLAILVRSNVISLTKEGELGGHVRSRSVPPLTLVLAPVVPGATRVTPSSTIDRCGVRVPAGGGAAELVQLL
jgi:hypothetical protein